MPVGAGAVGAATGVVGGLVSTGVAIAQSIKANHLAKKTIRPVYKIEEPIKDNQALAEAELANGGFSDNTINAYERGSNRRMASGIDAIIKSGGNANNVADLYGASESGADQLAMMNEQFRSQRVQQMMNQNERMAEEKDKAWQYNVDAPYKDTMARIAQLRGNSAANFSNAISSFSGAATSVASNSMYNTASQPQSQVYTPHANGETVRMSTPTVPSGNAGSSSIVSRYPGLQVGYSSNYGMIGPQQP